MTSSYGNNQKMNQVRLKFNHSNRKLFNCKSNKFKIRYIKLQTDMVSCS